VTSFCRAVGILALAAFFTAEHARSEDLDCTRYVPQIGKTVRVRCNDEPAAAPAEPKPSPSTDLTPSTEPDTTPVQEADSSPCLNEENPGTAVGICQVFLNNNAGLSQTTKVSVYRKLAYAALRIKDYQSALSWSKKSLEFTPTAVEHYIAGQAYAAMKNPSAAIVEFSSAIILAPKYTLALHRRGEAYQEIGDTANAKSDFEAAIALYAKFTPALEALRRLRRRG
jgi:tetratricopeptide (TPR) repeat protein